MSVFMETARVDLLTSDVVVKRVIVDGVWVECDISTEFDKDTGTLRVTFKKPTKPKRKKKSRGES